MRRIHTRRGQLDSEAASAYHARLIAMHVRSGLTPFSEAASAYHARLIAMHVRSGLTPFTAMSWWAREGAPAGG